LWEGRAANTSGDVKASKKCSTVNLEVTAATCTSVVVKITCDEEIKLLCPSHPEKLDPHRQESKYQASACRQLPSPKYLQKQ